MPRGLKAMLQRTAPVKLAGRGPYRGFVDEQRCKYKGLTKLLAHRLWSDGTLPAMATHGAVRRTGWKGEGGGRRRGLAIDTQLSKAINRGRRVAQKGQYTLTKYTLGLLSNHGLLPILAQRAVCDHRRRIATAIDILCYRAVTKELVVVELKCGHSGDRTAPAMKNAVACCMAPPIDKVKDTTLHRHFTQLAITRELFVSERGTLDNLQAMNLSCKVEAALLYVDDEGCTYYDLPRWWMLRAPKLLAALAQ